MKSISKAQQKSIVRCIRNGQVQSLDVYLQQQFQLTTENQKRQFITNTLSTIRTDADETIFHVAVTCEEEQHAQCMVRYLISSYTSKDKLRDDINTRGFYTSAKTVLHEVARMGYINVCRMVIQAGAKTNAIKSNDWTPLMIACYHGHFSLVKLLIEEHNEDLYCTNKEGATILHLCCKNVCANSMQCIKYILEKDEKQKLYKVQTKNGKTVLHYVVRNFNKNNNSDEIIRLLTDINDGELLCIRDCSGMLACHEAVCLNSNNNMDLDVIKSLCIEDCWSGDCGGLNVLHHAVIGGNKHIVKWLVDEHRGRHYLEAETKKGFTATVLARVNGYNDVVEILDGDDDDDDDDADEKLSKGLRIH